MRHFFYLLDSISHRTSILRNKKVTNENNPIPRKLTITVLKSTKYRSTIFKCLLYWNTTVVFCHGQPVLESCSAIPTHLHPMTEHHCCFHSVNICEIYFNCLNVDVIYDGNVNCVFLSFLQLY